MPEHVQGGNRLQGTVSRCTPRNENHTHPNHIHGKKQCVKQVRRSTMFARCRTQSTPPPRATLVESRIIALQVMLANVAYGTPQSFCSRSPVGMPPSLCFLPIPWPLSLPTRTSLSFVLSVNISRACHFCSKPLFHVDSPPSPVVFEFSLSTKQQCRYLAEVTLRALTSCTCTCVSPSSPAATPRYAPA